MTPGSGLGRTFNWISEVGVPRGTPKVPPISAKTGIINVQAFCLQHEAAKSRSAVNRKVVGSNPT